MVIGETKIFNYTGNVQTITLNTGIYIIECWGGGSGGCVRDGRWDLNGLGGAYVCGTIVLDKDITLFLYVGGRGQDASYSYYYPVGGWNGGGNGNYDHSDNERGGAGGGATDIRIVNGKWNDFESLKSRIIVAAGAGSSADSRYGTPGGDLSSLNTGYGAIGATQTSGYAFGIGQTGEFTTSNVATPGAGGGYYGGKTYSYAFGGATGGSSFISGHTGCNAIDVKSTLNNIIHTNQPNHYSNLIFTNTKMIAGNKLMPSYLGDNEIQGNNNNGAIRITCISLFNSRKNTNIYKDAILQNIFDFGKLLEVV